MIDTPSASPLSEPAAASRDADPGAWAAASDVGAYRPASNGPDAVALWHAAWALAVGLGAGLLLVALGGVPGRVLAALACGAVPGIAGWFLRPARGEGVILLATWAIACAFAMALTGGVSGPLTPWGAAPVLAGLMLSGRKGAPSAGEGLWRDGATLAFAAVAGVALIQATGSASPAPVGGLGLGLGLVALTTTLAGLAAWRTLPAGQAPRAAEPDPAVEAGLRARLQAEAAARAAAEADAQAKMRFLANMSHELRTPLNAIMGFSDIMRARLFGDLPPKYLEYSELIHESGRHLLDLINDVLDMSKIEADKYQLQREAFDVREAVSAALRILRIQADEAGVQLRGALPAEPLEVDADRRAIKQMVLNLVANALKFTPPGGAVTVTVQGAEAQASSEPAAPELGVVKPGVLELSVADTGVGIAPEDLARLGRPYEQAGDATARTGGTGLGLSLVKAFAGLHGGTMVIESRLGEGTAVTLRLPVLESPAAEAV